MLFRASSGGSRRGKRTPALESPALQSPAPFPSPQPDSMCLCSSSLSLRRVQPLCVVLCGPWSHHSIRGTRSRGNVRDSEAATCLTEDQPLPGTGLPPKAWGLRGGPLAGWGRGKVVTAVPLQVTAPSYPPAAPPPTSPLRARPQWGPGPPSPGRPDSGSLQFMHAEYMSCRGCLWGW